MRVRVCSMIQAGPYIRGHSVYKQLYDLAKPLFEPFHGISQTYESDDSYGGFWAAFKLSALSDDQAMEAALAVRAYINEAIGYEIVAKPVIYRSSDDANPLTMDAVCFCLVPKDVADRNAKYNGDAMVGAYAACIEAGVTVKIGEYSFSRRDE